MHNSPQRHAQRRACDRCRRRKSKCIGTDTDSALCVTCQAAGKSCTFDLPVGKRGPKHSRRDRGRHVQAAMQSTSPDAPATSTGEGVEAETPPPATWPPDGTARSRGDAISVSDTPYDAWLAVDSTPGSLPISITTDSASTTASRRWHQLSDRIAACYPGSRVSLIDVVNRCFLLFFEYLYPLTPLVHKASLLHRLATLAPHRHTEPSRDPTWLDDAAPAHHSDATFTLVTAVCAEAAYLLPKTIFPEGENIADTFLQASRTCLHSYLWNDLESPDATSIVIRYFHSNCLHAAGKPMQSWHIFGEAVRLVQIMRLHDESSVEGLAPVETELRRRVFWIVYLGDKSAALLNNRPVTIHKFSFDSAITTKYPAANAATLPSIDALLMAGGVPSFPEAAQEQQLIEGFNANLRLWQAATDTLLEMRIFRNRNDTSSLLSMQADLLEGQARRHLHRLYVTFATYLDQLPPNLQLSDSRGADSRDFTTTRDKKGTAVQVVNIHATYYSLRLVIIQTMNDLDMFTPGLREETDLRVTEISRDMLRLLHQSAFWSLQVNGEPLVEKIRLIGASLLALIHREDSPLTSRARNDLPTLLDVLSRLDSKASDDLKAGSNNVL